MFLTFQMTPRYYFNQFSTKQNIQRGRSGLHRPCVAPWKLQNFTLTWSFTKEHKSSTIYTYDSLTQRSSSVWKEKVRLVTPRGRGGDGSLQLHKPLSLEHTGTTPASSLLTDKNEVSYGGNITQTEHEVHQESTLQRPNMRSTKSQHHRGQT